jgi:glycosyltransferase involved in cell wall biosynthesis
VANMTPPPGLLRVLVVFHEPQALGAGISVLRVIDELETYGWSASGWIPGAGRLRDLAAEQFVAVEGVERPLAFSRRGWRESPGPAARLARGPGYAREFRSALRRLRPHVVHANTLLALPEASLARSYGLPVVMQVHELLRPGAKRTTAVRLAARVADVLVGVSDAVTSMLRAHAGRTPVLTVRNGVPHTSVTADSAGRPFTVGTIGTVSRFKGTDVFLRAARSALERRPDMRFVHAGAHDLHHDEGLDDEIEQLLRDLDPPGAVSLLGPAPAETVLAGSDVLVSASRSEGFPLVTLEAMAAGLPVVATAVGGVPEQIVHLGSGILVPPDDPDAIAAWLVRLHDEPELRRRLGEAAARRARSEFTLARQAEGLHRAYLTALDLRFGPRLVRRLVRQSA